MGVNEDFLGAGGGACALVAAMIGDAGYNDIFFEPPSPLFCTQPIVVSLAGYKRVSQQIGSERGTATVHVVVCRDLQSETEAISLAIERALRNTDWTARSEGYAIRVVGIDTTEPEPLMRDGSGRFVWEFSCQLNVVREGM